MINRKLIITVIVFLSIAFIIDYLGANVELLSYGKSGDLLFRILSFGIVCGGFFFILFKEIRFIFVGFFIWILLVLIHTLLLIPLGLSFKDIIYDHLFLASIMVIVSLILKRLGVGSVSK